MDKSEFQKKIKTEKDFRDEFVIQLMKELNQLLKSKKKYVKRES